MTLKSIMKQLEKHRDRISKERDSLRDVVLEYESLAEVCDTAIEDLNRAIDSLSEQA